MLTSTLNCFLNTKIIQITNIYNPILNKSMKRVKCAKYSVSTF